MKIGKYSWGKFPQTPYFQRSDAKNLADTDALDIVRTRTGHARDEILRVAQNDKGKLALSYRTLSLAKHKS
jgi:hypothetical protein